MKATPNNPLKRTQQSVISRPAAVGLVSSPRGFLPEALAETHVNVSIHAGEEIMIRIVICQRGKGGYPDCTIGESAERTVTSRPSDS